MQLTAVKHPITFDPISCLVAMVTHANSKWTIKKLPRLWLLTPVLSGLLDDLKLRCVFSRLTMQDRLV